MGRKNLLNALRFRTEVHEKMIGMGFRELSPMEFDRDRKRLGLVPQSKRKVHGREVGYVFSAGLYEVIVWTSYVYALGACRDQDQVHILIREGDRVLYKTREIRRTTNFVRTMLSYAWITRWKVLNRPHCNKCGAEMDLANGKFRRYWWKCTNSEMHFHGDVATRPWDFGLPPKALAFVKEMRKPGQKYRNKLRKLGKKVFSRIRSHIGKGWSTTYQQNVRKMAA